MFPAFALRVIRGIDVFTGATIWPVMALLAPLILSNVIEVLMRYVWKQPTVWAADMTVMTYGSLFMLGAAYTLREGAHVRTDIFWDKFSDRTKGIIDSVSYLLLFLPVMAVLIAISIDDFLYAWSINERSTLGLWQPIIWPFRAVVPLSAALLFLQGISEFLKALYAVRTGQELVHHEKVDI
ncbi:TRAP transporter small permease subunit [Piscinibacter sakaiensis]|uniref:TRAP transporter small permease subunit n=1 Tax=Piscinibacter sakaiensis TaxID=1547922 RepID=UPI003AAFBD4F